MKEILVIAPFDLTDAQIVKMENSLKELPYQFRFMETLLPYEKNLDAISPSTSAIVSRGGLGEFLRSHTSIPFIKIPVTPYDLLRSITSVYNKGYQRIQVMFFAGIFNDMDFIKCDFGALQIKIESYRDQAYAKEHIKQLAKRKTVDAIIGDRFATDAGNEATIPSFLVKSGEEALVFAVEQAIETLNIQFEEEAKTKELDSILQVVPQAVINVDANDNIKMFNEQAKHIFPELKEALPEFNYTDIFKSKELQDQLKARTIQRNILTPINNQQMLVTTTPIFSNDMYVGAIQVFERLADFQKLEMKIRKEVYKKGLTAKHTFADIVCENKEMKRLVSEAAAFSRSEGSVLIYGETGTGKELFAQSIHNASDRHAQPFVSLNCGALNENLLESELFGYEDGAFTGALKGGRAGLFEMAHEGTLFLDEINEMPRSFQIKLLRVLQENEVRRVGGTKNTPINVRIICATNQPMEELIRHGKFKEDLYYRISTLTLDLLPLRDRKEDIIPLATVFLNKEMERENRFLKINDAKSALRPLLSMRWDGNARELQNFMKRLVITYQGSVITADGVHLLLNKAKKKSGEVTIPISTSFKEMESHLWAQLYSQFNGTKEEFCNHYKISQTTLWRKLSVQK